MCYAILSWRGGIYVSGSFEGGILTSEAFECFVTSSAAYDMSASLGGFLRCKVWKLEGRQFVVDSFENRLGNPTD